MKVIIVTIWVVISILLTDWFFWLMNEKSTMSFIIGIVSFVVLIIISIKSKLGIAPYNAIKTKINNLKTKKQ
jgi:hypothetical protein